MSPREADLTADQMKVLRGFLAQMTPEQLAILGEFSANMMAMRRLFRWIAWIGGISTGAAVLAYYVLSAWHAWGAK